MDNIMQFPYEGGAIKSALVEALKLSLMDYHSALDVYNRAREEKKWFQAFKAYFNVLKLRFIYIRMHDYVYRAIEEIPYNV